MKHILGVCLVAFVGLSGCASTEPAPVFPDLDYSYVEPLAIDAVELDVKIKSVPPREPPYVDDMAPVSFAETVPAWARQRLVPAGSGVNLLEVTLVEGSITEQNLEIDGGIRGAFKKEQAFEYEARAKVLIRLIDPTGREHARATAEAWRKQTASEDTEHPEKRQIWFDLVEAVMKDLDARVAQQVRLNFGRFLL